MIKVTYLFVENFGAIELWKVEVENYKSFDDVIEWNPI